MFGIDGLIKAVDRAGTKIADAVLAVSKQFAAHNERLSSIDGNIARLVVALRRPPMPGLINIRAVSEYSEGELTMLNFKIVGLDPPGATDVVKRELSVKVNEDDAIVTEITDMAATEVGGFAGPDNASVVVTLVDIDDVGNRSEAREQTFTLVDDIAPPKPGEFGLAVESET
jgi:hypothetical protein